MTITALPALNQSASTFRDDADLYFNTELPQFSIELDNGWSEINASTVLAQQEAQFAINQVTLTQNEATLATQQAQAAALSAGSVGAIAWVSGTTYAIGVSRYSPLNSQVYRRIIAGAGTTDPSLDNVNWSVVNSLPNQNIVLPTNNLPQIRPSLSLDFANAQTVDPRVTFTRASTATRTNNKGLIEVVPAGNPRIDYDPISLACRGLLVEEQRTNLLTYSESFDNGVWVPNVGSVSPNASASPDGLTTADRITSTGAGVYRSVSGVSASTHTVSIYAKYVSGGGLFVFGINLNPALARARFDLQTGVVSSSEANVVSALITPCGSGWFRCSVTAILTSTSTVFEVYNGTSGAAWDVWGAQLEAGAFPTSYIPTVASQVTRAADVATMTGGNFSSWYRQDEGSIVIGFDAPTIPSDTLTYSRVYSINASTNANAIELIINGGWVPDRIGLIASTSNVGTFDSTGTANGYILTPVVYAVNATAYKLDNFATSWNGLTSISDNTSTVPVVNQIHVGHYAGVNQINGHIRFLSYYPERLSNVELQALSRQ